MPSATSQPANASNASGNAPVHAIRKHSLKASIWCNDTRNGPMYNVTLVRTYRDGDEYKDTGSLGFDDLTNAAKLLLDAETWIGEQVARDREESSQQRRNDGRR